MTEYEIADYASSIMSNFLSAITIYFSVITAYVVSAFVAGQRLSLSQLVIVNIVFTIAAGIVGILTYQIFLEFFEIAAMNQRTSNIAVINFAAPLELLILSLYIGSLVFMWTVRRSPNGG